MKAMKVGLVSYDFGEYCVRLASALAPMAEVALLLPQQLAGPHLSALDPQVEFEPFDKPRLRQAGRQLRVSFDLIGRLDIDAIAAGPLERDDAIGPVDRLDGAGGSHGFGLGDRLLRDDDTGGDQDETPRTPARERSSGHGSAPQSSLPLCTPRTRCQRVSDGQNAKALPWGRLIFGPIGGLAACIPTYEATSGRGGPRYFEGS